MEKDNMEYLNHVKITNQDEPMTDTDFDDILEEKDYIVLDVVQCATYIGRMIVDKMEDENLKDIPIEVVGLVEDYSNIVRDNILDKVLEYIANNS